MTTRLAALLSALALTACIGTRSEPLTAHAPLPTARAVPVEARGVIEIDTGAERVAARPAAREVDGWGPALDRPDAASEGPVLYEVRARFHALTGDGVAEALAAWPDGGALGRVVDSAAWEGWLSPLEFAEGARVVAAPRLIVHGGEAAELSLIDEAAFLSGFEIERNAHNAIADPRVRTVSTGEILGILVDEASDADGVTFELSVERSSLLEMHAVEFRPGSLAPLSLHAPIVHRDAWTARPTLGAGETLVLAPLVQWPWVEAPLVLSLTVEPVPAPGADGRSGLPSRATGSGR